MNKKEMEKGFQKLNEMLKHNKQSADILICGGASMTFLIDKSTITKDIDGVILSAELKTEVRKYMDSIGEELENNEWFNEGAKGYIDLNWDREELLNYSNLNIYSVKPEQLLAMKLLAARAGTRDMEDSIKLIKHLELQSMENVFNIIEENINPRLLTAKVEYFAQKAFAKYEEIKGAEENMKNETDLAKFFKSELGQKGKVKEKDIDIEME